MPPHRATLALSLALAACGSSSPAKPPPTTYGGSRPVTLQVPAMYDASKQYPLFLVLHGYGANGFVQEAYFGLNKLPPAGTAFVLAPDGMVDSTGHEFWNADPACCDFDHTNVDDSGYLGGLLKDVTTDWPIDPSQVYVIGHSNGGYMAYRLACDHADLISNIVVLAGAAASDPTTCQPSRAIPVLHLHGTADTEVPYNPNANASVTQWAMHDGCDSTFTKGAPLDLDTSIAGAETVTETAGCPTGMTVELWSIQGAGHIPAIDQATFPTTILQYLQAHRR